MTHKKLAVLTGVEIAVVVAALAVYLGLIGRTLRSISKMLGEVSAGVRAIERQTEPVGPTLAELRRNLGSADAARNRSEAASRPGGDQ